MLPTAEGGRNTPFAIKYRPQFYVDDPNVSTSLFLHNIEGCEQVSPGESATVEASLLMPELFGAQLASGTKFWLREVDHPVGWGVIC